MIFILAATSLNALRFPKMHIFSQSMVLHDKNLDSFYNMLYICSNDGFDSY